MMGLFQQPAKRPIPPAKLEAQDVSLVYHQARTGLAVPALAEVNLAVAPGEFASIVGPSGCGKSTFLLLADGLLRPTRGRILLDGREVTCPGPDRAMVFQDASLLPWRTVWGNVRYGLELQRRLTPEAEERARRLLEVTGLAGFEGAYPSELSGGMQQRANLARALATDPEVLLMDEPFAALDAQTREMMQQELLAVWQRTRKTVLFITHQINEAIYLSDRVFIFCARPGRVKDVIRVDLPRPRPLSVKRTPAFLEYEDAAWKLIEDEVRRAFTGASRPPQQ